MRRALRSVLAALVASLVVAAPTFASAATPSELVSALANQDTAPAALDALVALKGDALPALTAIAVDGHDLTQRGWAIVGLRRIGGAPADATLAAIVAGLHQPVLVRTWAAAARIDLAPDLDALLSLVRLVQEYPAVRRPFMLHIETLGATGKASDLGRVLSAEAQDVQLQAVLAPLVAGASSEALVGVMLHATEQQVRMLAASHLASRGQARGGAESVATVVVQALAFQPGAASPPWHGGPLYIPGIAWTKGPATQLVGELIRWLIWADLRHQAEVVSQIANNLNSLGLGAAAGYDPSWGSVDAAVWLRVWGRVGGGRAAAVQLLSEQGAAAEPRYQGVLKELR